MPVKNSYHDIVIPNDSVRVGGETATVHTKEWIVNKSLQKSETMCPRVIVGALVLLLATSSCVRVANAFGITIDKSAYRNVVIEIQSTVPVDQCAQVLNDLEVSTYFKKETAYYLYWQMRCKESESVGLVWMDVSQRNRSHYLVTSASQ